MSQDSPLSGLRVVDLTTTIYGPYATQFLGDLGADVIKVEAPAGDPVRFVGPAKNPGMGALFLGANRNKRSIVLDLKNDGDKDVLWTLIGTADILVHNMRPQKMAKLGFGPAAVLERFPELVYAGLHGYGETGPYAERPAYDDVIQGEAGTAETFRLRDGAPALIPSIAVDKGTATFATTGILAAHIKRQATGKGVYVEIPMFESMVGLNFVEHQYGGMFKPAESEYGYPRMLSEFRRPHQTSDGYICMLAYTDRQWAAFWGLTSRPELAEDARFKEMKTRSQHIGLIYEEAGKEMRSRTTEDWLTSLAANDIPAGPVNTLDDVRRDPHLNAIGFFEHFDHETEGPLDVPGSPFRFDNERPRMRRGQPQLGADTASVLREAGVDEETVRAVIARNGETSS